MKKLLPAIFSVLLLTLFALPVSTGATNQFSTDEYTITLNSPRMHYTKDDYGTPIPLSIYVDYAKKEGVPYQFQLRRLDTNGNAIEVIKTWEGTTNSFGFVHLKHEFKNGGFPYEVTDTINNISIMKGFVLDPPSEDFKSTGKGRLSDFALAVNDVAYNTGKGFLFNPEKPEQHLVKYGDYFILHYRMPYDSLGNDFRIKIAYENEKRIFLEFSMDDIYNFQGGATNSHRWAFIVVSTNGKLPPFVDNRDNIAVTCFEKADNPFTAKFEKGVYTIAGFDRNNVKRADGQSPLLIGNKAEREWYLSANNYSVRQGYLINWTVIRETKEISDVFNRHSFFDAATQKDFGELISSEYKKVLNIGYIVEDVLGVKNKGFVYWTIQPSNSWYFGLNSYDFEYSFKQEYEIRTPQPIEDNLKTFLGSFGFDNTIGYMLFSVIMLIAVTFVLAYYGANTSVIAVADFGLIGLFATMGFIPLWLIVGMVMFAVAGLITVFRGRE